jgi:hypothetical protein
MSRLLIWVRDWIRASSFVSVVLLLGSAATADVVYETEDPFGGLFGIIGLDVSSEQSVAVRFTPKADHSLDRIRVWLWNNDTNGGEPEITITLRPDAAAGAPAGSWTPSRPTDEILETWTFSLPYTGFAAPRLFDVYSKGSALRADVDYWICAESNAPGGKDPVWAMAQPGLGFGTTGDPATGEWWPGAEQMAGAMIVEGTGAESEPAIAGARSRGSSEAPADMAIDLPRLLSAQAACPDCPKDLMRDRVGDHALGALFDDDGGTSHGVVWALFVDGVPDCPADINGDCTVEVLDLPAVRAAWGNTSGPEEINGDCLVDVLDQLKLLTAWGPC